MSGATRTLQFLTDTYCWAKAYVIRKGFEQEIQWQLDRDVHQIREQEFLRESAWVILSGGMRESVIRLKFPELSAAFFDWVSASRIQHDFRLCRERALQIFAHPGKIDAILTVARRTSIDGFEYVRGQFASRGVEYLRGFPYLGPATAFHLAKNLGLDVAKPDRHLLRMAEAVGIGSPEQMCRDIAQLVGDPVRVVDLVLWRFATLHGGYLGLFTISHIAE